MKMRALSNVQLALCAALLLGAGLCVASPVSAADAAAQGTEGGGNAAPNGEGKIRVPVDSSKVIPEGPQWLGAPIMPGGTQVSSEPGQLVTRYDLPYTKVLEWYKEALKRYPDARYRDWEEEVYIEDQGGSRWHAIKISKPGPGATVTIKKDNWTWILSTLLIRFIGVFVVLLVLWIFLNISSFLLARFLKEEKEVPPSSA